MKAITYDRFGGPDVLRYEDMPKPEPADGELLVRVKAAALNPLDWHMLRGKPRMIRLSPDVRGWKPMRPGRDLAGTVEAVGRDVSGFRVNNRVFGATQGAFAEYVCGPQTAFARMPSAVSFDEAAATPIAGLTALQALRDSGLRSGERVLVNGAGGGVGTFAVQLAREFGAQVTGVCSAASAPLVRQLGAGEVIDYRLEDFTERSGAYDLIVDLIGNHPYRRLRRALASGGRVAAVGGGGGGAYSLGRWIVRTLAAVAASKLTRGKVALIMSRMDSRELAILGELIASERLKPVIDRRFPLDQVPDAFRYLGEGHAHGKVIISI
jgi:NADPH:quinone reductase-like Zn-dependent oxidoreductase